MYLALALTALILVVVLLVQPKLRKGDGWLGITVQWDSAAGKLVIGEVIAGSPAYDVGMLSGDAILSYGDVGVSDINTLKQLIHDSYVNELVRIIIERNGRRLVAGTRIAERPKEARISPPIFSIAQGASPPHADRGLCVRCHTIIPRNRR